MPGRYVLDAYALLAFFFEQPGANEVAELLADPSNNLAVSAVTLGEVSYLLQRRRGIAARDAAFARISAQPNLDEVDATWERILAAAEIKAGGRISYADAFAAALAREQQADLVTGAPEFGAIQNRLGLSILWLPLR